MNAGHYSRAWVATMNDQLYYCKIIDDPYTLVIMPVAFHKKSYFKSLGFVYTENKLLDLKCK